LLSAVQKGDDAHSPSDVSQASQRTADHAQPQWDDHDIAAAVDPYSDQDHEEEWQADFEAACEMNLFDTI